MEEGPHYVRVMGPLVVAVNGRPTAVAGRRKKALLAALCLRAGTLVPSDLLVEAVWPGGPPAKALGALRVHISHLRRMLRVDDTVADPISTGDDGYGFMRGSIDALVFERHYENALAQRDRTPRQARAVLAEGLDLWRADIPLLELSDVGWARPEITRLTELRREATDELVDLRLRCGEHANLVPELEARLDTDSLSERRWAQLMLALYRAGQQSRALDAYARARRTLIQELGIEPTHRLSQLEHQILTHDPDLVLDTRTLTLPEDGPRQDSDSVVASVRALGPNARAVVDAAAVLGDRVPISMLSAVSLIDGQAFLAALDDCERTGIVQTFDGEVTIASPMVATVILDDLGRIALAGVHAQAANALRGHPLADPDRQADALARHSVGAIGIGPAADATQNCLSAARRAEVRAAFEVAAAHYRNARLAAQHLEGLDAHRGGLAAAVREAECLIRTGAVPEAVPIIFYVIEQARSLPDPELFAEAVLVASRQESMISDHPGSTLHREALKLLPEEPSAARVRLMALLAISLVMTDRSEERERLAREAVTMARALPENPVLLSEALAAQYQATFHAGNLRQRTAWATEASQAAVKVDDHVRAAHTLLYCTASHVEEGDRTKTDITLRAANLHAKRAADARYLWASSTWQALLQFADGNYEEGARLGAAAVSYWNQTPNADAIACDLTQQTMVALMRGDMNTAAGLLTGAVAERPDLLGARFMLCYALGNDRPSDADRLIGEVGPNPVTAVGRDQTQLLCWAMLAEAAGVLGPRPWLEDLITEIGPFADHHVVVNILGGGGIYWGCLGHHLGTAQYILGRHADARTSFEAALIAHRRFGAGWWVERTNQALRLNRQ